MQKEASVKIGAKFEPIYPDAQLRALYELSGVPLVSVLSERSATGIQS